MPHIGVTPSRPGAVKISGALHLADLILLKSACANVRPSAFSPCVVRRTVTGACSTVEYLSTNKVKSSLKTAEWFPSSGVRQVISLPSMFIL